MSGHSVEKDADWTGCVHCGQTLPHEGTGWREAYRCRLFQRIAEQAWDAAADAAQDSITARWLRNANPYRVTSPAESPTTTTEAER